MHRKIAAGIAIVAALVTILSPLPLALSATCPSGLLPCSIGANQNLTVGLLLGVAAGIIYFFGGRLEGEA